ncbi:hypothetical protein CDAR_572151 [Caerostris darwini]|uniref:Uncharacterized protein n=1 Tax=Caerostris darwini TaxID=1538125 RepID=A0AAV4R5W7_9ARAC|nr:hypothetical protein CDAR_572151 [Caerostris darwini]
MGRVNTPRQESYHIQGPVALVPISAKPRNYNGRLRDPSGKRGGKPRISFGRNHFLDLAKLTSLCLCIGASRKGRGRMFLHYHYSDANAKV